MMLPCRNNFYLLVISILTKESLGEKLNLIFGIKFFTFVSVCDAVHKYLFFLRFIPVAQSYFIKTHGMS